MHEKIVSEGLTLVIVPKNELFSDNSYGEFLGLTNSAMDVNHNNYFFVVEFDTLKQTYDP